MKHLVLTLKFLSYNQCRQLHTNTYVNLNPLTRRRLKPLLWPTLFLQHTQAASFPPPLSPSLSVTHSPAFPSSFSDLMSSSAQAPLGSTVNCGVSSHSRWKKKKKTHTRIRTDQCTHHSNQHTQCTTSAGRSQPCLLRLHPDRLLGSHPLRATQLHFLLLFFLSSVCASLSLPLSMYLFSDTPCGS